MTKPESHPANPTALSELLLRLAHDPARERIAIGDLLAALGERAFGALIFIFAFPNVLPTPPGTSTLLGAPLVFLAAQLCLGWQPWLPRLVAQRSMSRTDFSRLVKRIHPWLVRAERLLQPRMRALTRSPMEHVIGAVCLVLALLLVLPIPLGNVLPALAISFLGLGLLERDGIWVMVGYLTSAAAVTLVSGVIFALVKTAIYFFTEVLV